MENMEPNTPYYIYDADRFADDIALVKKALGNIPLTYSIKANPVMTGYITGDIRYVEVCSPGELKICKADQIDPDRILYSGVVKGEADVEEAIEYGVRLFTAESPTQFDLVSDMAERMGADIDILLRLSGGNQFGMSSEAIEQIVSHRSERANVTIKGLHFYGGTQKRDVSQIEEDLENLYSMTRKLKEDYDFEVSLVEYGPGLFVDYFGDITADSTVSKFKMILDTYRNKLPLGIEMGRFLAAGCGEFITCVRDIKTTGDITYAMVDGGINHLNYFGQKMAMKVPHIRPISQKTPNAEVIPYCVCGSLCTTADILVRQAKLPRLSIGDRLLFADCGAYSGCEAIGLFLSRSLPEVYIRKNGELSLVRNAIETYSINIGHE